MTTVITGATGFLGSHRLVRDGRRVTALARRDPPAARGRLAHALKAAGAGQGGLAALAEVHLLRGDVSRPCLGLDTGTYRALAEEAKEIWHCAAGHRPA
ncbi:predicted protein [Streptomyces viridosporus ATCC 14672]|uniref:Predicted protein n=1 Tax=Streptomyces viridosporus (strain ATCC 14672 / DSM 40746 / JCM 4963 / KCTC 9882 / NRRL B-12104 / FH 1290) TaxID=566461 RepID=D5ZU26_STRV1|nr:SDR family oxidoreductase [Streptomyces viridosporus]EFE64860.1 predicted protein [Streptomyces viridosporus ATCC 14672]